MEFQTVSGMNQSMLSRRTVARTMSICFISMMVLLLGAVAHYISEVRSAREATPALVQNAWQRFGKQVKYTDLSPQQGAILLAVEDPAFFRHHGIDLTTPGAGMTTITQGLVKLLYFPGGFEPGLAKIRQSLIAQYALDALVSKNEQLDLLLNMAYMGSRDGKPIHGFANAAKQFFGKELGALSDAEFQALVAMLIAPNQLPPGSPAHAERMRRIDAYLSGQVQPASVLDVRYDGKAHGSLGEEALMALLRVITNAQPADGNR